MAKATQKNPVNSPAETKVKAGYKQTELGLIPEDWDIVQLKEVVSKIIDNRGKTPPYSNNPDIELIETVSISFVAQHPNYLKVTKFVSSETFESWFRGHPINDDILVSTVGEYSGASAIMGENRGTIAQNLIALRIKNVNPIYVFYWTRSGSFKGQLTKVMMSQAQPSLRVPWLLGFYLNIPSLAEQNAIADVLSDADALIEHLEKLIAKKKAIKQGAMQQLLTGKKLLPGFSGVWEVKKLGEVCRITTGKKDVNEGNPSGAFPFFTCSRSHTYSDAYSFDEEAILVAGNGEVGNLHYYRGKFEAYQRTYVLVDFRTDVKYLWYQLDGYLVDSLGIGKIGSSIPYIKMENLVDFKFHRPTNKEEQTAIATVLSDMDAEIESLELKRDKYTMLKQGMMQELLTGKTRLV